MYVYPFLLLSGLPMLPPVTYQAFARPKLCPLTTCSVMVVHGTTVGLATMPVAALSAAAIIIATANANRIEVISDSPLGSCTIDADGCATDGPGDYGNNEMCTYRLTSNGYLTATGTFSTEGITKDFLIFNNASSAYGGDGGDGSFRLPEGSLVPPPHCLLLVSTATALFVAFVFPLATVYSRPEGEGREGFWGHPAANGPLVCQSACYPSCLDPVWIPCLRAWGCVWAIECGVEFALTQRCLMVRLASPPPPPPLPIPLRTSTPS